MAVFAPEEQVREGIAPYTKQVSIAAINGPQNIVISGATEAIEEIVSRFESSGVKTRRLTITQAAHSPLIDPILDEFEQTARTIRYSSPQIEIVSSLYGRIVGEDEVCSATYWRRHLREPVQFAAGIQSIQGPNQVCIEIGPGPVLTAMAQRFLTSDDTVWLPSIREGKDDLQQIMDSLAAAWVNGVEIEWEQVSPAARRLPLPTYPFQRQRCWIQYPSASQQRNISRPNDKGIHPLIERQVQSMALTDTVFETHLSQNWPPFLEHHRIFGVVILPSPAFLEMALTAAEQALHTAALHIENFSIQTALLLPAEGERTVQIILKPAVKGRSAFQIVSLDGSRQEWTVHASGDVLIQDQPEIQPASQGLDLAAIQSRCATQISKQDYYQQLQALGLEFGPRFQGLDHIWRTDGEALGRVILPEALADKSGSYHIHPAFLDACLHLIGAPLPGDTLQTAYLLIGIDSIAIYHTPGRLLWNQYDSGDNAG